MNCDCSCANGKDGRDGKEGKNVVGLAGADGKDGLNGEDCLECGKGKKVRQKFVSSDSVLFCLKYSNLDPSIEIQTRECCLDVIWRMG